MPGDPPLLAGRAGVVTGAGRGIGREIALTLGRLGAAVVVNDAGLGLDGTATADCPADQTVAAVARAGGRAVANTGSVTSWDGARAMVDTCVRAFGRIDFVVNNAGILRDVIFHKMTEADWESVIAVHLTGSFNVARAAAERFRAQGAGAVVNMTSTSGLIGTYGQANYAAAKLGLVGLTRSIALDMRRFGVRANAIAPFAWTRMTETLAGTTGGGAARRAEAVRQLRPAHVAPLVAFLVSDAARDISGQVFVVRGAEISLVSLPRPVKVAYRPGGWTPDTLGAAMDVLREAFVPLETTSDVFTDEPRL